MDICVKIRKQTKITMTILKYGMMYDVTMCTSVQVALF